MKPTMDDILSEVEIIVSEIYEFDLDREQACKLLMNEMNNLEDIIAEHNLWELTK